MAKLMYNNKEIGGISSSFNVPVGTILPFASNGAIPAGYLYCDGRTVSRALYAQLFEAIGITFGAGDGSTTFNLPDLNDNIFLEGSSSAGTAKEPGLPNIEGTIYPNPFASNSAASVTNASGALAKANTGDIYTAANGTTVSKDYGITLDASRSSSIYGNSETVQPKSLTVKYIIKAYDDIGQSMVAVEISQYIAALNDKADKSDAVPLGTILPFTANGNIPAGYLLCDGSAVSRSMYPDLFELIGTMYGSGDGETTFNLPDLTNKFIEGSITAGTEKDAGLPNIEGTLTNVVMHKQTAKSGSFSTSVIGSARNIEGTATANNAYSTLNFDASKSNSVYGASNTVQPPALTMRYIIKAFNSIESGAALIDITQYANEVNQRYDVRSDMTIIYPNGGTAAQPANVTKNSRYVMANPFPGYLVACTPEILYNNQWGNPKFIYSSSTGEGVSCTQLNNDTIVVQTGGGSVSTTSYCSGDPFNKTNGGIASAPCRVKVWKIGKINS